MTSKKDLTNFSANELMALWESGDYFCFKDSSGEVNIYAPRLWGKLRIIAETLSSGYVTLSTREKRPLTEKEISILQYCAFNISAEEKRTRQNNQAREHCRGITSHPYHP